MARKKQPEAPLKTDGWLNTYADMVTLLLCFFVMMYTASIPDAAKMQWILRALSPISGDVVNPVVDEPVDDPLNDDNEEGPNPADPEPGDIPGVPGPQPLTFDDMYNWVAEAIEKSDLSSSISVGMDGGKMRIRFDDDIMFAPDSAELLPSGRRALNLISTPVSRMNDYIESVVVEGHTAGVPQGMARGIIDWNLSSMRASNVTDYLDYFRNMVDSEKFQTAGFGQYKPIESNEQEETRRKNRRVELVITRNEFEVDRTAEVIDIISYDYGLGVVPGGEIKPRPGEHDQTERIRQMLYDRYGIIDEDDNKAVAGNNSEWGPVIPGIPSLPSRPAE